MLIPVYRENGASEPVTVVKVELDTQAMDTLSKTRKVRACIYKALSIQELLETKAGQDHVGVQRYFIDIQAFVMGRTIYPFVITDADTIEHIIDMSGELLPGQLRHWWDEIKARGPYRFLRYLGL